MAYVLPTALEEEEMRKGQSRPAAAVATSSPGMGGTPSPQPQQAPAQVGTGFIDFGRYLNANRDASKRDAEKLAGGIARQGQAAQGQLKQAQQGFSDAVTAGSPNAFAGLTQPPEGTKGTSTKAPAGGITAPQPAGRSTTPAPSLSQRAGATYSGPSSLSGQMGDAGWDEILKGASAAQEAANVTGTQGGLEASFQKQNAGQPYTQGQSRMDAMLAGSTSPDRFQQLRKDYGSLVQSTKDADAASRGQADAARVSVEKDAAAAQAELDAQAQTRADGIKKMQEGMAAENAARDAVRNLFGGQGDKRESWVDYTSNNRLENTLRTFGGALDPINNMTRAAGGRGTLNSLTEAGDNYLNDNAGTSINSSKFNFGTTGFLGNAPDTVKSAFYDSLSKDEVARFERMPESEQQRFYMERIRSLGDKAVALVKSVGGRNQAEITQNLFQKLGYDMSDPVQRAQAQVFVTRIFQLMKAANSAR